MMNENVDANMLHQVHNKDHPVDPNRNPPVYDESMKQDTESFFNSFLQNLCETNAIVKSERNTLSNNSLDYEGNESFGETSTKNQEVMYCVLDF